MSSSSMCLLVHMCLWSSCMFPSSVFKSCFLLWPLTTCMSLAPCVSCGSIHIPWFHVSPWLCVNLVPCMCLVPCVISSPMHVPWFYLWSLVPCMYPSTMYVCGLLTSLDSIWVPSSMFVSWLHGHSLFCTHPLALCVCVPGSMCVPWFYVCPTSTYMFSSSMDSTHLCPLVPHFHESISPDFPISMFPWLCVVYVLLSVPWFFMFYKSQCTHQHCGVFFPLGFGWLESLQIFFFDTLHFNHILFAPKMPHRSSLPTQLCAICLYLWKTKWK